MLRVLKKFGLPIFGLWTAVSWALDFYGKFQSARDLFDNRGAVMKWAGLVLTSPWLPLVLFILAVGWIGWIHYCDKTAKAKAAATRGDLYLTVRNFDYDASNGQLYATLNFYNDDSMTRSILGVNFLYRKSAGTNFHLYHTGPPDTLWIGHLDEVKLPPKSEETKHYRSIPPKIAPELINRPGAQSGLNISFTNAKRQTDHAVVMAMENPPASEHLLVSRSWPTIENLSLDSIRDSLQLEEAKRKWDAFQRQSSWYRRLLSRLSRFR
jgi:hypothetical protein